MTVFPQVVRTWVLEHRFLLAAMIPLYVVILAWSLTNVWLSELGRVARISNTDYQSISSIQSGDCSQTSNALTAFVPESRLGFVLKSTELRGLYSGTSRFKPCLSFAEYQALQAGLVEDAQHYVWFSRPWDAQRWVGALSDANAFMKLLTITPDEACLLDVMRTARLTKASITYANASECAALVAVEPPSFFGRIRQFFGQ